MDLDLRDKVVVVTGASQGIGLAVARAFAHEGANVVAGARRSSPELDALSADGTVVPMAVDLATPPGPTQKGVRNGPGAQRLSNVTGSTYVTDGGLLKTL